jgi:hypothetical protein
VPESVIDRIGSVDNPMSVRRASGTLAKDRTEEAPMASIEQKRPGPRAATETMRAAVVEDFASPLVVKQVAKPVAGQGEIVVRVQTSGLCHTDIHAAHGDWPVKPSPPFIPGHEGIGTVEELGSGVTQVAVGDRVAMPWLGYACGSCDYCVSGWETLCLEQKNTGYSIDGGFAEYMKAYGRYVVRVPDGVNLVDAAPLTCAGVTTYKADHASYQSSSIRDQMSDGLPQVLSASRPTRQQVRAGNPKLLEVLVMSSSPGPARPSHGRQGGRR